MAAAAGLREVGFARYRVVGDDGGRSHAGHVIAAHFEAVDESGNARDLSFREIEPGHAGATFLDDGTDEFAVFVIEHYSGADQIRAA